MFRPLAFVLGNRVGNGFNIFYSDRQFVGIGDNLFFTGDFTVAHQNSAVADNIADAGRIGGINHIGKQIIARSDERVVQIDKDAVGKRSFGNNTGVQPKSPGSVAGGGGEDIFVQAGERVLCLPFADKREDFHLFQHAQVIVGGSAVGTERDFSGQFLLEFLEREKPGNQFEV